MPLFLSATVFPPWQDFKRMDESASIHSLWKEKKNCLCWKCQYFFVVVVVTTDAVFAHICI